MDLVHSGEVAGTLGRRRSAGQYAIWAAMATLVVAATIAVAVILGSTIGSRVTGVSGSGDQSYDRVEALRGGTVLPVGSADRSYDRVEHIRIGWRAG